MPEQYKRNPNIRCTVCGRSIYRRPIQLKQTKGKAYCGQACYGISCRNEKPCVVCGVMMLSSLHKKTCSRVCANKHRIGIKYKINRPNDKSEYFRVLKLRLVEKRGSKCERCDYCKIEVLQIHHKDRNRRNNKLENLELVCPNCHFEEHHLKNNWITDKLNSLANK